MSEVEAPTEASGLKTKKSPFGGFFINLSPVLPGSENSIGRFAFQRAAKLTKPGICLALLIEFLLPGLLF